MKFSSARNAGVFARFSLMLLTLAGPVYGAVNVPQYHNHATRDGLFVDPAFTISAAAGLKRDLTFQGVISGNVYAQPLYIEGGPGGQAMVIAVTESNNVYALNAADGSVIWQRHVGTPVGSSSLPCGNINPLGITGTPVVDLPSRTLFFDAMTTPDSGTTKKHLIFALNVDSGTTNSGWPVDLNSKAVSGSTVFTSVSQNQRSALAVLGGYLYTTYAGHAGDCSTYYGWLVGMPIDNPASVMSWATTARGGGSWSVGGVSSDGVNPYIATGNTFSTTTWGGGEAIIRFSPGPVFSNQALDYWSPTNWLSLDNTDLDIGGSGGLIVDVPGATPSKLVVALGKDGTAYLLNRTNLGGVSPPLAQAHLSSSSIIQAAATYQTTQGVFVVFCPSSSQLVSFRITPTSPPAIASVRTNNPGGRCSPFVTSSDGTNDIVVWTVGAENDQRLHGFEGNTGAAVFAGGGASELMAGTRRFQTAIAARGRIYVATDNKIYAFTVPIPPIVLSSPTMLPGGAFQFRFTNTPGLSFTAFGSTNITLPLNFWSSLGMVTDNPPGQFQFIDPQAATNSQRFYRVRSP